MVVEDRFLLGPEHPIEIDETCVGGVERGGVGGRLTFKKAIVAIAGVGRPDR